MFMKQAERQYLLKKIHGYVLGSRIRLSEKEVDRTYLYGDDIHIRMEENKHDNKLTKPYNSKSAPKMTTLEMRDLVWG